VRPTPPPEPLIRFETPAGRQAQVDFARFRFPWGVRYALLVVLGYSRLLWCRFYPRQDMRTRVSGLEEAFRCFGGVPREVLFDQMKAVITRDLRLEGGALLHNAEFLRFARHWDFTPRACRPYRAQTSATRPGPTIPTKSRAASACRMSTVGAVLLKDDASASQVCWSARMR
jgi:transposase